MSNIFSLYQVLLSGAVQSLGHCKLVSACQKLHGPGRNTGLLSHACRLVLGGKVRWTHLVSPAPETHVARAWAAAGTPIAVPFKALAR
jgi:hypothetical protein